MKRFFLAFCLIFTVLLASAQSTGTLKGFLYEKGNGEAVPFANVFLKGTTIGVNTDLNGFFSINRIPPEIIPY